MKDNNYSLYKISNRLPLVSLILLVIFKCVDLVSASWYVVVLAPIGSGFLYGILQLVIQYLTKLLINNYSKYEKKESR